MCRIALDDPCLDGVGKNSAEETNGTRGRSSAASDDSLSAQLLGLDRNPPASTILFVILTIATDRPLKQPL
jgi:hypothetical protein